MGMRKPKTKGGKKGRQEANITKEDVVQYIQHSEQRSANLRRILRELNRGLAADRSLRLDAAINSHPYIVRIAEWVSR